MTLQKSPPLAGTFLGPLNGPPAPPRIAPLKPTPVYDTYWRFAAERQNIFFRRFQRLPAPWTTDPILLAHKFTNAYRASDRVSQYLIRRVIYRDDLPNTSAEVVFRILLFKVFNRIDTWEMLENAVGAITWKDYSRDRYEAVLSAAMKEGSKIYSAAYIMPSASTFGHERKHQNHLALIEQMLHNDLPEQIAKAKSMQSAFDLLRSYPTIGDFLAYQYVTDINYSNLTDFSEMEFVVPGPGSLNGIRKCFYDTAGLSDTEVIRFMADRQDIEFQRLGIDFKTLWGRPLQLVDCQNLFCETDKYARVSHPEFSGATKRTRIKQLFRPHPEPISYWYPPKWGINSNLVSPPESAERTNSATSVHTGVPDMELNGYQARAALTDRHPANDNEGIMIPLLGLAGEAGELLTEYKKRLRDGDSHTQFRDRFSEELGDILWYVANLATKLEISLAEVAERNLIKCEQRWKRPLPLRRAFDEGFPNAERFPRRFLIDFATNYCQQEQPLVRLYFQNKPFGDVLTDNAYARDGYGYHDALHLAFAAVLGWSPLTRKMLGVKRKSNKKVDEVEDGGRAIATEEGVSAMIFAYAKDYNWLEGKSSVSTEVLRMIQNMTMHLEVSVCTSGEWESAIIKGFTAWREVKNRGSGTLVVDLDDRSITLK